jgi:predicted dehydrogenase
MMEEPIRVAVIGCGWAGMRHAEAYRACGADLGWAVDLDRGRAQALRGLEEGIRTAADYREPLDDPEVDAVDICLPHDLHAQVAVKAAEAGKHILCEKPIAAMLEGADRMIEAAERAGVVLMIAENVRFTPLFHRVRDLLRDGVIGQPALIQMTRECYLAQSFLEERRWFLDARMAAGGIMMSGGVHDFETMRMLIGEVESIQALRARQRFLEMEGDDTSIAMVRFCDGTVGTLVESFVMKSLTTAAGPEIHTLRIDGDLGSLSVRDGRTIRLFSEREDLLPEGELTQHDIYVPAEDTFALEIEHFIQCIRKGVAPITSGRSQRRPLEIVLAAYRSMASGGQPVMLS